MAPSPCIELAAAEQLRLLRIARDAIAGLLGAGPVADVADDAHEALLVERAVFVTLSRGGALRGCIGSLTASAPLARGVAEAALGAAFRDPRFPPLTSAELDSTAIEISVLSELAPVAADDRRALLAALRPSVDGLLLEEGPRRSTFLPKVWEQLPDPEDFLAELLAKAGLPADYWSPTLRAHRYTALCFGETAD